MSRHYAPRLAVAAMFTLSVLLEPSALAGLRVADVVIPKALIKLNLKEFGQTALDSSRIQAVVMGDLNDEDVPTQFVVHGIRAEEREYCVDIVRSNNLFTASFSFRNEKLVDAYRVKFEIDAWSDLRPIRAGELAIRVRAKKNGTCTGALLPARWGSALEVTDGFVLYNGGQSLGAAIQLKKMPTRVCSRLSGELIPTSVQNVSFNYACPIRFEAASCAHDARIFVLRESGEHSDSKADSAQLRLVCPSN